MKTELDLSNMSGLDDSLLQNYSNTIGKELKKSLIVKELGNGFFKKDGFKNLSKKHIDGTIQEGKLIDTIDNKIVVGYEKKVIGNNKEELVAIKEDYPKDKGVVQGDGEGNYFYFPELPEFIKAKIAELEKLKKEADEKQAAKIAAENKSAAEKAKAKREADAAEKKFQLQKADAERKAKEEERKAKEAEAKRVATEKEAEIKLAEQSRLKSETESKAKTKKMLIIGGSVAALVVGFLIWRKFGK